MTERISDKTEQRTDMAVELLEKEPRFRNRSGVKKTEVVVDARLSRRLNRPKGRYITLECAAPLSARREKYKPLIDDMAAVIRSLCEGCDSFLAVGVGNPLLTADALGSRTVKDKQRTFLARLFPRAFGIFSGCLGRDRNRERRRRKKHNLLCKARLCDSDRFARLRRSLSSRNGVPTLRQRACPRKRRGRRLGCAVGIEPESKARTFRRRAARRLCRDDRSRGGSGRVRNSRKRAESARYAQGHRSSHERVRAYNRRSDKRGSRTLNDLEFYEMFSFGGKQVVFFENGFKPSRDAVVTVVNFYFFTVKIAYYVFQKNVVRAAENYAFDVAITP